MSKSLPRQKGFAQNYQRPKRTYNKVFRSATQFFSEIELEHANFAWTNFARSFVNLDRIKEDVSGYTRPRTIDLKHDDVWKYIVQDSKRAFKLPKKVNPIHINDVRTADLNWAASAGLPWICDGPTTKREVIDEAIPYARWFWHNVKHNIRVSVPDATAFARSHLIEVGEQEKVRAVWGTSLITLIGEAVFASPLTLAYKLVNTPLAWDMDMFHGGMSKLSSALKEHNDCFVYEIDWKSFDKRVASTLIYTAFDILKSNMDFTHYEGYGIPNPYELDRMWNKIVKTFIYTKIRFADGTRVQKCAGVPSGSFFTNIIDGIVNYLVCRYIIYNLTGKLPRYHKVMGDDCIVMHEDHFTLNDFAAEAWACFQMFLSRKKSRVHPPNTTEGVKFLGYELRGSGTPFRPLYEILGMLFHPERTDESLGDVKLRAIGLAWANLNGNKPGYLACLAVHDAIRHEYGDPPPTSVSRNFQRMLQMIGLPEKIWGRMPDVDEISRRVYLGAPW